MKKLDREEARILAAVERSDWRRRKTAAKDMAGIVAAARATVRKDERVNNITKERLDDHEDGKPHRIE